MLGFCQCFNSAVYLKLTNQFDVTYSSVTECDHPFVAMIQRDLRRSFHQLRCSITMQQKVKLEYVASKGCRRGIRFGFSVFKTVAFQFCFFRSFFAFIQISIFGFQIDCFSVLGNVLPHFSFTPFLLLFSQYVLFPLKFNQRYTY